jgi:hypothetical protein
MNDEWFASPPNGPNTFPTAPITAQTFPKVPKRFPNDSQTVTNSALNALADKHMPFLRKIFETEGRFFCFRLLP